jgi:hypothetical protein
VFDLRAWGGGDRRLTDEHRSRSSMITRR